MEPKQKTPGRIPKITPLNMQDPVSWPCHRAFWSSGFSSVFARLWKLLDSSSRDLSVHVGLELCLLLSLRSHQAGDACLELRGKLTLDLVKRGSEATNLGIDLLQILLAFLVDLGTEGNLLVLHSLERLLQSLQA